MLSTKDILRKLKDLREEMRLNQENIANELGIDRTTYIRKEHGAIPITTDEWIALAAAMQNVPSYFFNDNEENGANARPTDETERRILSLYRALKDDERRDLLLSMYLAAKGIRRKKVQAALEKLLEVHESGADKKT